MTKSCTVCREAVAYVQGASPKAIAPRPLGFSAPGKLCASPSALKAQEDIPMLNPPLSPDFSFVRVAASWRQDLIETLMAAEIANDNQVVGIPERVRRLAALASGAERSP